MIIPDLDLLSADEKKALLKKAETLWKALQTNELGGFSDQNRPFYIFNIFQEIIEDFGHRNTGYRHSQNDVDKHFIALKAIDRSTDC